METLNYSIIIPHKNSPILLRRCLDSIPQREDIEVIVVDDNSDDQAAVKQAVIRHPRARLYSNDGYGAGGARNTGLKHISGQRLLFIDADDFFHEGFLSVTDKYLDADVDLVFFDTDSVDSETLKKVDTRCFSLSDGVRERDLEYLRWRVRTCWGKLFRSEYILKEHITFDEVKASNDVMFACMSSYKAKTFDINPFCLVCSTINRNSLVHNVNKASLDSRYAVAVKFRAFAYSHGKGKYASNLLSFVFYYRDISNGLFLSMLLRYFKDNSCRMILDDLVRTGKSIFQITTGKKHSGRKLVKINN